MHDTGLEPEPYTMLPPSVHVLNIHFYFLISQCTLPKTICLTHYKSHITGHHQRPPPFPWKSPPYVGSVH